MSEARRPPPSGDAPDVVGRYSPRITAWFQHWLRGYFRRNFDAVRTLPAEASVESLPGPILVYTNHPSWWDPIHFLLLARELLPRRRMFGPFEVSALERYRILKRVGAFGIDPATRRGAAEFLTISRQILQLPDTTLWITAQGKFSDPRARPLVLQPGVAHLARRLERGWVVPLAVEYPFWDQRRPEALSCLGSPIDLAAASGSSSEQWNRKLTGALTDTMDQLAAAVEGRDPAAFQTLVRGRSGVGGIYDLGRRLSNLARGKGFDASHPSAGNGGAR